MKRLYALSASAGSGKTFALVARYLALLFSGANPSEILAITFTNKAAGEMRERVVSALTALPETVADEVSAMCGLSREELRERRPEVLRRFLAADLKVMTIDRFIHQVLRRFCWYAGLPGDFEIAATPPEEFFESFLTGLDDRSYRELVDFARFEARKRHAIAGFFELLYEKDRELPPMPDDAPPCDEREVMKWALKIREFFLDAPVSERAKKTMAFETPEDLLKKSWIAKESLDYWDYKKGYAPAVDGWLHALQKALAECYKAKERHFLSRLYRLYRLYRERKVAHMRRTAQLHFKDIEHLVYGLLRRKEFTDFLYFRLDARIGHILFDEFQDTSVTQYRIFEPIIEEIAASESDRTFFYVGDTKQSIYRFRGGQKALFDYVARRFGVEVGHLRTNYRSRREIVEFVNRTFDYVKPPQLAHKEGGFVEVAEEAEPLEGLYKALTRLREAGVPEREIAVLVHDNKEILKVGELVKERFGLEIATHKRSKVAEQPGAKALIELMRLRYAELRKTESAIHRLNFLTLVGRPYDPGFRSGLKLRRPAAMLREAMERHDLFDESAMRLLEFAIPLHDLVEFVHAVERYEEELPPRQIDGIHVLTIHKSKGLEFGHVVVLDRLGQGSRDRSGIIFDYEGIELKALRMKFKHREAVDPEYAEALAREKALAREDAMNRAYVAFTRAEESLTVVKKPEKSAFGFLDLPPQRHGRLVVQAETRETPEPPPPLTLRQKDYGRQAAAAAAERYEANDFEAIYLGQGVHYLFETEDFDAFLNRFGGLCDVQKARRLYEAGRQNMAYAILTEGEAVHEMPYVLEGREGIVDLFVDRGESGVVVDFKTATPHDITAYEEQLRRYREALRRLMPEKREIDAYLYFLDTLELRRVE